MNFGKVASEDMPYCELEIPVPKDEKAVAERVKIYNEIGIQMPKAWVYEELGIPMPIEGEEIFGGDSMPPAIEPEIPVDEPDIEEVSEEITDIAEVESAAAVDLRPTEKMARNAANALEVRRAKPQSERGMTSVGLARARDISSRSELSEDTVRRMVSFFSRHEVDKNGQTWDEQGKGWQAWNGWGGDEGFSWAKSIVAKLDKQ
jgi:hypothetical protein